MRSWNTPLSTFSNAAQILSMSRKVSVHSSSWPSSILPRTSLRIIAEIFACVGSGMERTAASTVSESMRIAASEVCGFGPS